MLHNGTLGFVEMEMKATGFLDTGCDLKNPNFAAMAKAMGVRGICVGKPRELLRKGLAEINSDFSSHPPHFFSLVWRPQESNLVDR